MGTGIEELVFNCRKDSDDEAQYPTLFCGFGSCLNYHSLPDGFRRLSLSLRSRSARV